jgi:hypothetical protein
MPQQITVDKETLKEILKEIAELKKLANHKTDNDNTVVIDEKKASTTENVCFKKEEVVEKK